MEQSRNRIERLLALEPLGDDAFLAPTPSEGPPRLFGGQVAAQSLRAATLTVEAGRPPHSLHAYFMRPGRPGTPLRLDVDRMRDGRSFTTRQVTASQEGEAIFTLTASFHAAEEGDDWQLPAPSGIAVPDSLPPPTNGPPFAVMLPFDIRPTREPAPDGFPLRHPFWLRAREVTDADPALHACVLAFLSDMAVVSSARAPGSTVGRFGGASLDHAMWFHRPARADEWLLFSVDPVSNAGARGLALGTLHDRAGVRVASIAQEALLRPTGGANRA